MIFEGTIIAFRNHWAGENLNFNARQIKRLIFSLLRQHFTFGVTMKFSWGAIDWIDTQSLNNGNYMALDLTT